MPETSTLLLILLLAMLIAIVLLVVLLLRKPDAALVMLREQLEDALRGEQREGRGELRESLESLARAQATQMEGFGTRLLEVEQRHDARFGQFREALSGETRAARNESSEQQLRHNNALSQRINELTERTDKRLDEFRIALGEQAQRARAENSEAQRQFAESLGARLRELIDRNAQTIGELRVQVDAQLKAMQTDNAQKLEQMRATVDEKLQSTLEARLGHSFKLVSERLEAVQRGLGEMQALATGVGDLKRVLTNVKDRGGWGEIQLENLLEQVLTAEQFARGVKVRPGSNEAVDFAIRLPGQQDGGAPVWLPIDAKFPREDYERLLDAQERGDAEAMRAATTQLERAIKLQGKSINEKYIAPPHTTDFAVLFLATEGLYAEAVRRPGLVDSLQQTHRIVIAGPTTLAALLNSLQMGFRTLAIEKRSSEVWQLLGAVKSEFGKFALVLESADKQLNTVQNSLKQASVRTRQIEKKLKGVESLPGGDTQQLLDSDAD